MRRNQQAPANDTIEASDEPDLDTILTEQTTGHDRQRTTDETEQQATDRLAADIEQLRVLQAAGFTGPEYEAFRDQLWMYAMPVMHSFMLHNRIVELCQAKNVPIALSDHVRQAMHTSWATRDELAVDTIAAAERYFRESVLKKDKWRPSPGAASLTSYFIGACAFGFQRALRTWEANHRDLAVTDDVLETLGRFTDTSDPVDRAITMDLLRRILDGTTPQTRTICNMLLHDRPQAEIAEQLGISTRAVEGRLRRLRRDARRTLRRDQHNKRQAEQEAA